MSWGGDDCGAYAVFMLAVSSCDEGSDRIEVGGGLLDKR